MLTPLLCDKKHSTERVQPALATEMWGILSCSPTEKGINETDLQIILQIRLFFLRFRQEDKVLKGNIFRKVL